MPLRKISSPPFRRRGPSPRNPGGFARRAPFRLSVAIVAASALILGAGCGEQVIAFPQIGEHLHSIVVTDDEQIVIGGHGASSYSADRGETWHPAGFAGLDVMALVEVGATMFVAGHTGIHRGDGGVDGAFDEIEPPPGGSDVHALGSDQGVLYAASASAGLLASEDGGESWQERNGSVGQRFSGPILVDEDTLIAADQVSGVVRSTDAGRTWEVTAPQRAAWLTFGPSGPDDVIVSGPSGAMRSPDGGVSWESFDAPEGAIITIWGDRLLAASQRGSEAAVAFSDDEGQTWRAP